mmetsp:Transcript_30441/g.81881  ORF Transcript_30441/g.81881 Transcript_30441/m.81881 type:complete len:300 (-) Transcript_30441:521-1420(-)
MSTALRGLSTDAGWRRTRPVPEHGASRSTASKVSPSAMRSRAHRAASPRTTSSTSPSAPSAHLAKFSRSRSRRAEERSTAVRRAPAARSWSAFPPGAAQRSTVRAPRRSMPAARARTGADAARSCTHHAPSVYPGIVGNWPRNLGGKRTVVPARTLPPRLAACAAVSPALASSPGVALPAGPSPGGMRSVRSRGGSESMARPTPSTASGPPWRATSAESQGGRARDMSARRAACAARSSETARRRLLTSPLKLPIPWSWARSRLVLTAAYSGTSRIKSCVAPRRRRLRSGRDVGNSPWE